MKKYANISGILGLVLFAFGFVTYLFTEVLTLYSLLHIVSGIALLVYFAAVNLSNLKNMLTGRAAKTFGETSATAIFLLGSVVVVNLIAAMSPKQFDWTKDGIFSLSEASQKMLASLDVEVEAKVFQQGGMAPQIEDLLKLYAYEQPKFSYEVLDPERNPELAEEYEVRQNGTVILEAGGRRQKLTEDISEESVTNGLRSLLAGQNTTVGFLTGHDELASDDEQNAGGLAIFATLLKEQNYHVQTVSLFETAKVPSDIDILVIASPSQPLFAQEQEAIADFVRGGGKLLLLADPLRSGAEALLQNMGIANAGKTMLIDQSVQLFAGPTLGTQVLVSEYGDHEAVANFPSRTLFAQACALELPVGAADISYTPILSTSRTSWAERDLKRLLEQQEAEQNEADILGPVVIGAAFDGFPRANSDDAPASGGGFVICDSDFLSNRFISQAGNADLALNLIASLAGETEQIAIGPKKRGMSQVTLTRDQMVNIFYGTVLIFPEALLLAGLFVWWQRRQQR